MREPVMITLGGRSFAVRPLTVTQIEKIEGIVFHAPKSAARQACDIIAVALARDHAEVDVEDAGAGASELGDAAQVILRFGGFLPDLPGEGKAAAANAPTGKTSVAASRRPSAKRRPK